MATPTTVNSEAINRAATRTEQGEGEVRKLATQAINGFSALSSSWTGEAASAFQSLMPRLNDIFTQIGQQMQKMEADVRMAGGTYTRAGGSVDDAVRTFAGGLPGI